MAGSTRKVSASLGGGAGGSGGAAAARPRSLVPGWPAFPFIPAAAVIPSTRSLRMSCRTLSVLAILVLLIVPSECYSDPEEERLNYLNSNKLHLLQRILQKGRAGVGEMDPALQGHHQRAGSSSHHALFQNSKRGAGACINSCLSSSGMSFVRCKSMCH